MNIFSGEFGHSDFLVAIGSGFEDEGGAVIAGGVDGVADEDWGCGEFLTQALFPEGGVAGHGVAEGFSSVADAVDVPVFEENGGYIDAYVVAPDGLPAFIGPNDGDMVIRVAAAGDHVGAVGDHGGDAFGGGPFYIPELFTSEGVQAGDEVLAYEDALVASVDIHNERRGVVGLVGTGGRPDQFACFAVKACDSAPFFVVAHGQDQGAIDCSGRAVALVDGIVTKLGLPELFSVQVEGGDVDRIVVEEVDENAIAIGGGCGGGAGGTGVPHAAGRFQTTFVDYGIPKFFTGVFIDAEDGLDVFVIFSNGHENLVANNDGRTVAPAGYLGFPLDIGGVAPVDWGCLIGVGDAVPVGAAPPGPIGWAEVQGVAEGEGCHGQHGD